MSTRNAFTSDESVLCINAARYGALDFGGLDAIHAIRLRPRSAIQMKIPNPVAMCDSAGISRSPEFKTLTGVAANGRTVPHLLFLGRVARNLFFFPSF